MKSRVLKWIGAIAICCSTQIARSQDVQYIDTQGHLPDLEFTLKRSNNRIMTQDELKGKVVMVFFGYSNCPDICPTTMTYLTFAMDELKDDAKKAQILFISVDPHRDEPDILQKFADQFNNGAIGLTGDEDTIAALAKRYRVSYQIDKPLPGDDPNNYQVMHAKGIYVFDQKGESRLLSSEGTEPKKLANYVRHLIHENDPN
ncbi:MAG: SCO family protein [Alcaligenaceae bacterium]|nr:SCO family protein [Alcaligenaceae bacterium]